MSIIDFHSHILPKIDDGSQSSEESIEMIRSMIEQGVTTQVATPHFYAHRDSIEHFLSRREASFSRLQEVMKEKAVELDIRVGSEVYYFGGMEKAEMLPELCLQGTDIILLEMPFAQWTEDMLRTVERIITKQKLTVMMAHIERFWEYQKDRSIWNEIFELPVIPQINTGEFLNWKKRRKCLNYIKNFDEVVLGSDCHNMRSRVPNLQAGREVIAKKLGTEAVEAIDIYGERLLKKYE